MHSFQRKAPSSSPSSPSPSPYDCSHRKHDIFGFNLIGNRRGLQSQRRKLTRQRKLRHVEDQELGLEVIDRARSLPVSPDSILGEQPPGGVDHWSSFAVPQPLPLPELSTIIRRREGKSGLNTRQGGVRSPGEGGSRGEADGERAGERPLLSSGVGKTNTGHVATQSVKSSTEPHRGLSQDFNFRNVNHNLMLNIPINRSAPSSGFSSPTPSPRRSSIGDFFPSSYVNPHEFQVRSVLEVPTSERLSGCSSQVPPVKTVGSTDHSPLHSPTTQSPRLNPKSPRGTTCTLHNKLQPESSMPWPESNSHTNVHPLPLPPGALAPSQSANIHHASEKPNVSSMNGQWQKGKLLGRGTFGSVYVATNCENGSLCAMKEVDIIPDDPKSAECIKQLEQEIKVLQQLKHRNIVQYLGSEIIDDHFYIYLEYVHPGSINKYVREHFGAMTESVVRNFTRHIVSGLAYLHSKKTIHRDIKGANLLVDAHGVVKLADFGMAKLLTGQASELSLKGSPYWMAPEVMQAAMQKDANPDHAFAVDIWSLGCTIIEMLNGQPPWSELEGPAAMFKVLNKTPPIPDSLSSEGKDFLHHCFRRNPAERPSAVMLLKHPFLQNSREQNISLSLQAFSGMKLMDRSQSPKDSYEHKSDLRPFSPVTGIRNGNLPWKCHTFQQCYAETPTLQQPLITPGVQCSKSSLIHSLHG
ncbi:hypothetical protein L1049_026820 [Liquidambar formosana]|uniref:mitogen-activated protein kinase kinase kinase n=1 Tax=Liquidambar formosana TaxID=63359 RepID=A0AAP0R6R0_LIQFO